MANLKELITRRKEYCTTESRLKRKGAKITDKRKGREKKWVIKKEIIKEKGDEEEKKNKKED